MDSAPAQRSVLSTTDGRRRRGRDTQQRIMSAAAELFARHGFDATSTQAIAAASGITVAAIYRHYPSKAELLVAVAQQALETTFADTIAGSGSLTIDGITDIVIAYTTPERAFTRRLVVELAHAAVSHPDVAHSIQTFHQRARHHLASALAAGQHTGDVSPDLDPNLTARDLLLLIMGICHADTLDPAALADPAWPNALRRTVRAVTI